jgi:hypothetical protein
VSQFSELSRQGHNAGACELVGSVCGVETQDPGTVLPIEMKGRFGHGLAAKVLYQILRVRMDPGKPSFVVKPPSHANGRPKKA